MESHLIAVTDTYQRFVAVPSSERNALDLADFHDAQVESAATQDVREYHQRAAAYYLECAGALSES